MSGRRVNDLKIPKKKFVLMVLQWCSRNVGSVKDAYTLKIHYFKHKRFTGLYYPEIKQIEIFVYNDLVVKDLVSTLIHEYFHHIQAARKSAISDYDKKYEEFGLLDNPYEVEARKIAKQHTTACLSWVLGEMGANKI